MDVKTQQHLGVADMERLNRGGTVTSDTKLSRFPPPHPSAKEHRAEYLVLPPFCLTTTL